MTKEEVIQLWKENDVDHIDFVFSCGGDSMNETEIVIYDSKDKIIKDKIIKNKDIEDYFDEQVYNAVEFYVNSDGVYMGEDGTVTITLEKVDDEVDFIYSKSSTEEWNETESFSEKINLTDEEVEFIDKYCTDFNGNMSESTNNVNYKTDFIQTDELVAIEENLIAKISNYFDNYEHNLEEVSDWNDYEIDCETLDKDNKTVGIIMNFQHYVYKESESDY
jgi:Zn ribbon nucleic-acid-binding protein